jgi:hypothetical protein
MSETKKTKGPPSYRWIPTTAIEPGMVTARPIITGGENQVAIRIGVGSTITASTIAQLINKGVECIAIEANSSDLPDEADYTEQVEKYQARLSEIFGTTPDENCRPLFDALIETGPCPS